MLGFTYLFSYLSLCENIRGGMAVPLSSSVVQPGAGRINWCHPLPLRLHHTVVAARWMEKQYEHGSVNRAGGCPGENFKD